MFKSDGTKAFNDTLRNIDESVSNIKLCGIEIQRESKSIVYNFVCEKTVSDLVREKIVNECMKITPPAFVTVEVKIIKIVADSELIALAIYNFIKDNYPSLTFDFNKENITVSQFGNLYKYVLNMIPSSCEYCRKNGTINKINQELEKKFVNDFSGSLSEKAPTQKVELCDSVVYEGDLQTVTKRIIKVSEVQGIDDFKPPSEALYIDDAVLVGEVVLCGKILQKTQKLTAKGKPFYIFEFTDKTGKMKGIYFTKKNTLDKIEKLSEGDDIIVRGKMDYYNDKLSFTIDRINLCKFPEDFIPQKKAGNTAASQYSLIKPEKVTAIKESSLFDQNEILPHDLVSNEFVVFDIETTGTEVDKDEITEIGAIKITGGKISESFQTLVKPKQHISDEIVRLTGIDDEMVKNAPSLEAVLPDFFKFTRNAILVAHNADFDCKFIKHHSAPFNYYFDNEVLDTLALARENVFGLKNYKLNTVAEHFDIQFLHHRALSDAQATAEVFIELIKIKKSLR